MPIDFYSLAKPLLFRMETEKAHDLAIRALGAGLAERDRTPADPILATSLWGLEFTNPLGLAAGFDKNAEVPDAVLRLGFGFTECGTVTPRAQPGNPKPRMFRLFQDRAAINRLGFNSEGLAPFVGRLAARRSAGLPGIVGANVGKNRDTEDAASDYVLGIEGTAALADYLVVNISSPNTKGLRDLQARTQLKDLIVQVLDARARPLEGSGRLPPLLVKVAPDLHEGEMADIAEVALDAGIDGLIVGNTTIDRPPGLKSEHKSQAGGLSGVPLMKKATACLGAFYQLTEGRLPLIGCGGVASGADAYAKIRAGASLVQLYTALVFQGPRLVGRIKLELADLLRRDGFAKVADAVGANYR